MKREIGYYWVKNKYWHSWTIAEWTGDQWDEIFGYCSGPDENDFEEIDERRIEREERDKMIAVIEEIQENWISAEHYWGSDTNDKADSLIKKRGGPPVYLKPGHDWDEELGVWIPHLK